MMFTGYVKRKHRQIHFALFFGVIVVSIWFSILMFGETNYSPATVLRVLSGEMIKGASFAIGRIRMPRAFMALLSGFAFGLAGNTFQNMLRNPLASPDVIGVSAGTSAAAVFGILILGLSGLTVSLMGVVAGVLVSMTILYLSSYKGFNPSKLILVGIGVQAFMGAMTSFMIERSSEYEVASALRWLSGSLNGVQMNSVIILLITVLVFGSGILLLNRYLTILQLGDELSITLGVPVHLVRALLIVFSVVLVAVTTSITGPIAAVSFLAPPISKRLVKNSESNGLLAGLFGAVLVGSSDLIGQNLLGIKFPVGVITGLIGAPYLLYLLIKLNNKESGVTS